MWCGVRLWMTQPCSQVSLRVWVRWRIIQSQGIATGSLIDLPVGDVSGDAEPAMLLMHA